MKRPMPVLNPQQRMLADLLALGLTPEKAAGIVELPVSHVKVLLKGSLFTLEVDRARERLLKQRREEFAKQLSDELGPNIAELRRIRDNAEKDSDRLHAIDTMLGYIAVPAAKKQNTDSAEVHIVLEGGKKQEVEAVLAESTPVDDE